jgi:hypothetical protein
VCQTATVYVQTDAMALEEEMLEWQRGYWELATELEVRMRDAEKQLASVAKQQQQGSQLLPRVASPDLLRESLPPGTLLVSRPDGPLDIHELNA